MPDDIEHQAVVEELNRLRVEVEFLRPHVKGFANAADRERDDKLFYQRRAAKLQGALEKAIVYLEAHGSGLSDEETRTLRTELKAAIEKP